VKILDLDLNLLAFEPYFKFETAHTQTLLGHFIKSPVFNQKVSVQSITLSDGDQMSFRFHLNTSDYIVVIFHGLGGTADSDYMHRTAVLANRLGHSVALVEHRGVGHTRGSARRPYHSGRGEDASAISEYLRQNYPNKKQIFIGFSLSGSVLLNLLTKRFGQHLPDFGIVVNAPIKLNHASARLQKGFSKFYDLRFYFMLKKMIKEQDPKMKLPLWGSTQLIDKLYTSQKSGFIDDQDYYKTCSTFDYLTHISVPTFVLTSEDDPFIVFDDYMKAQWNELTHRTFLKYGGHMGYICRQTLPVFKRRWLDHYLDQVLKKIVQIPAYTHS